jgi:putative membrane protein
MLWIKTFHIIFVASWFAGLFYLPRIFVNLAMLNENEIATKDRLIIMSEKLMRFMTILMIPSLIFGFILWGYYGVGYSADQKWMHLKFALVGLVVIYHYYCFKLLQIFKENKNKKMQSWYRWFNEIPVILMVFIVSLVVHKPIEIIDFCMNILIYLLPSILVFLIIFYFIKKNKSI